MANAISLITKYQPELLDKAFAAESKTYILENPAIPVRWVNAHTLNIPAVTLQGLGNYSKTSGYPTGDVTVTWEALALNADRSRSFTIDAMDDEECGNLFGYLEGEFVRLHVIPEVDAYRFAKIATAGTAVTETVTVANCITGFNNAIASFEGAGVPKDNSVLFVSSAIAPLMRNSSEIQKVLGVTTLENGEVKVSYQTYDGVPIIVVPADRFFSQITLGADGYTKHADGKNINYMLVNKDATLCVKKHESIKVITPEANQTADGYKINYRLYHDCFVPANKTAGIYVSKASA